MVIALRVIGWIVMTSGVVAWISIWGSQPSIPDPNQSNAYINYFGFAFFLSGVISGILFLAVAEIINVLRDIRTNTGQEWMSKQAGNPLPLIKS